MINCDESTHFLLLQFNNNQSFFFMLFNKNLRLFRSLLLYMDWCAWKDRFSLFIYRMCMLSRKYTHVHLIFLVACLYIISSVEWNDNAIQRYAIRYSVFCFLRSTFSTPFYEWSRKREINSNSVILLFDYLPTLAECIKKNKNTWKLLTA